MRRNGDGGRGERAGRSGQIPNNTTRRREVAAPAPRGASGGMGDASRGFGSGQVTLAVPSSAGVADESVPRASKKEDVTSAMSLMQVPPLVLRGAYSPEHAAHYLDVSRAEVYRLLARGELRGFKWGRLRRILRSELDRFLVEQMASQVDDEGKEAG